jgi:uncharacterized LabA/DUF88 family protein
MPDRQIAILIDGGFFLKRLPKLMEAARCDTPEKVAACIRVMCRNHVKYLTGDNDGRWHRHVYRIFYYDAVPFEGVAHHPVENRQIAFGKSNVAIFRAKLFDTLRRQRNVALRLGKVIRDGDWSIVGTASRKVIATKQWITGLDLSALEVDSVIRLDDKQQKEVLRLQKLWASIENHHVRLPLKQKGVDMRIGLDIASLTLKRQVQTIILVAGDSDFVPAAKLARREGVQFILDPMWQAVNADLFEHIDGLQSGLAKPKTLENGDVPDASIDDVSEDAP